MVTSEVDAPVESICHRTVRHARRRAGRGHPAGPATGVRRGGRGSMSSDARASMA